MNPQRRSLAVVAYVVSCSPVTAVDLDAVVRLVDPEIACIVEVAVEKVVLASVVVAVLVYQVASSSGTSLCFSSFAPPFLLGPQFGKPAPFVHDSAAPRVDFPLLRRSFG